MAITGVLHPGRAQIRVLDLQAATSFCLDPAADALAGSTRHAVHGRRTAQGAAVSACPGPGCGPGCRRAAAHAPFFEVLVREGRSTEQGQRLLAGFTDLLVQVLGVERVLVRGCCHRVSPVDWGIAGVPASVARGDEVRARAQAAKRADKGPD